MTVTSGGLHGFIDTLTCGDRGRRDNVDSELRRRVYEALNYRQIHYPDVIASSRHTGAEQRTLDTKQCVDLNVEIG